MNIRSFGNKARQARALSAALKEGWKLTGWTRDFRPIVEKADRRMAINLDGEYVPQSEVKVTLVEQPAAGYFDQMALA